MQRKKKVVALNEFLVPNKWLYTFKHPDNFLCLSLYLSFLIKILCLPIFLLFISNKYFLQCNVTALVRHAEMFLVSFALWQMFISCFSSQGTLFVVWEFGRSDVLVGGGPSRPRCPIPLISHRHWTRVARLILFIYGCPRRSNGYLATLLCLCLHKYLQYFSELPSSVYT